MGAGRWHCAVCCESQGVGPVYIIGYVIGHDSPACRRRLLPFGRYVHRCHMYMYSWSHGMG
eukprot:scaffold56341_cov59-Phaeocystis_antarctica.AAC.1